MRPRLQRTLMSQSQSQSQSACNRNAHVAVWLGGWGGVPPSCPAAAVMWLEASSCRAETLLSATRLPTACRRKVVLGGFQPPSPPVVASRLLLKKCS